MTKDDCPFCQDEDGNPTGRVPASARLMLGEQVAVGEPDEDGDWEFIQDAITVTANDGESWGVPVYRVISPEDTP
jgi:hypothetical protein